MTYPSDVRLANVLMASVLDPASGSVTPNACNLKLPSAMRGRYLRFCSSLP